MQIHHWDLLMVGDGSGTSWDGYCGWAATLVERTTRCRRLFYGGMYGGSVNMAELLPYFQAISWFHARHGKERLARFGQLQVPILTDSKVTVNHAHQAFSGDLPKVNTGLWAGMVAFRSLGYLFRFHWVPRESMALHWLADALAGNTRAAVKDLELADDHGELSPYQFSP